MHVYMYVYVNASKLQTQDTYLHALVYAATVVTMLLIVLCVTINCHHVCFCMQRLWCANSKWRKSSVGCWPGDRRHARCYGRWRQVAIKVRTTELCFLIAQVVY